MRRVRELLVAAYILSSAGCLIASRDAGVRVQNAAAAPTRLDYVVLASMADAPRPLAMASYRPQLLRAELSPAESEVAVQFH